jgi:serine/threonine-protein kinase
VTAKNFEFDAKRHSSMTLSANLSMSTSSDGFDLSGRTVDDFRILRKLGQGGMGQVYLAEQMSLKNRKVALKILPPDQAALRSDALPRFKAEAEAVANAIHPHIIQVYAYGEFEGMPYMALEYVDGRNLKDDVALKGPPEKAKAIRIMRQVASALQRAGELGIIHRDIKPENILLARTGEVKVADFGLARLQAEGESVLKLTQSGVTMGTPLYMSPEQIEGKSLDSRTDIYSLGATCYHMLTGQPPFRAETALAVALQHLNEEPAPLVLSRPDLPGQLCAIVHKMMAKKPTDRYQTAREVMRELSRLRPGFDDVDEEEGAAELAPSVAGKRSIGDSPTRTQVLLRNRRGLIAVFFVLSLLLAVALGVLLAWRSQRNNISPDVTPADLDVSPTARRERKLSEEVEAATPAESLEANMALALFYLDENRIDDAETLFNKLQVSRKGANHVLLGKLGNAFVRAMRNEHDESNKLFHEVLNDPDNRTKLEPVLNHPRWRMKIGRARWFNHANGLREDQVPSYLKREFVITAENKLPSKPTKAKK